MPNRTPLRLVRPTKRVKSMFRGTPGATVRASSGSGPVIAFISIAQSITVRAIGPAPPGLCEMGTRPPRLTKPGVGLRPRRLLQAAGEVIEPSVSVPMAAAQRFAAAATAEPELEPLGVRS